MKRQSQQRSSAFLVCQNVSEASMANSVDPDQTAPMGAVCSGYTLFAYILKFSSYVGQLLGAENFSRRHVQIHFFLALLRAIFSDKSINKRDQVLPNINVYKYLSYGVSPGNKASAPLRS